MACSRFRKRRAVDRQKSLVVVQDRLLPGRIHTGFRYSIVAAAARPVTANRKIGDRCTDSARMESVRILRRSFQAVELIENLVDGRGRDAEVVALRVSEAVAYVGEHGEFTFEVCCGLVAQGVILPWGGW